MKNWMILKSNRVLKNKRSHNRRRIVKKNKNLHFSKIKLINNIQVKAMRD
jgi:hypothetical protein